MFLTIKAVNKDIKAKENFTDKLPSNLRLRILGNYAISGKSQNIELLSGAQSASQNENFVSTGKNLKNRN